MMTGATGSNGEGAGVVVVLRLGCSLLALALCYWGVTHWPRVPDPYGAGFWAWIASLVLLLLSWSPIARPRLPRPDALTWLAVAMFIVAGLLRFYRVDVLPFAIHFDETAGSDVLYTMHLGTAENIFSRVDFSTASPGLLVGIEYLLDFVMPSRFVANRYASAIWGTLSIIATYGLAQRVSSRSVALVAAAFLTVSSWHLLQSRFQPFFLSTPFAAAATWWALVRACESRRIVDAVLAGIVFGFGLQLYNPVKVLLVAIPLWWIWHAVVSRGFFLRTCTTMGVACAVAGMSLAPLVANVGWGTFWERVVAVSPIGSEFKGDRPESLDQAGSLLRSHMERQARLVRGGAHLAANHPVEEPLLNWAELGGAALGALVAVRAVTDWRATVAPVWLVTTTLAVLASSVPEASYRLVVALPALAILAAVGWIALGRWTISLLPRPVAVPVVIAVGLAVLAYDASTNGTRVLSYLRRMEHAGEITTLGREIASGPATAVYYVVAAPGQVADRVFLGLTHNRTVVAVTNLNAQVPRDVDPNRPAIFVVPSGAASELAYLRNLYATAAVREIRDPSGFLAGHLLSAEPMVRSTHPTQHIA